MSRTIKPSGKQMVGDHKLCFTIQYTYQVVVYIRQQQSEVGWQLWWWLSQWSSSLLWLSLLLLLFLWVMKTILLVQPFRKQQQINNSRVERMLTFYFFQESFNPNPRPCIERYFRIMTSLHYNYKLDSMMKENIVVSKPVVQRRFTKFEDT